MWTPTHIQVTVFKARNLIVKGKHGNNAFVTMALGKEKFQTGYKLTTDGKEVVWNEQCEFGLADVDNTSCLTLTVRHLQPMVAVGFSDFLGCLRIPLSSLDHYEKAKPRWFKLEGKPGKEKGKDKERGDLEVRITFTVRAASATFGSQIDINKKSKHKSSLSNLSNKVGGSLLSLGSSEKRLGIKKVVKNIGKQITGKKREANGGDGASDKGSVENLNINLSTSRPRENVDPGVISEDEDEFTLDNLSHKSSGSSLNLNTGHLENLAGGEFLRRSPKNIPLKPPRAVTPPTLQSDEWEQKLCPKGDTLKRGAKVNLDWSPVSVKSEKVEHLPVPQLPNVKLTPSPQPAERRFLQSNVEENLENTKEQNKFSKFKQQLGLHKEKKEERFIVGEESSAKVNEEVPSRHDRSVVERFRNSSRDDLIDVVLKLEKNVEYSRHQMKDMEDYLDKLLLRVMETTPKILQNPYMSCKPEFKSH